MYDIKTLLGAACTFNGNAYIIETDEELLDYLNTCNGGFDTLTGGEDFEIASKRLGGNTGDFKRIYKAYPYNGEEVLFSLEDDFNRD